MALITGTVKKIQTREVNGKFGPATAFNLGVEQDGQSELTWIGAGFKNPGVREESRVTIMANQNAQGYWQCKPENIEVLGVAQPAVENVAPQPAASPAPAPASQAQPKRDVQSSITMQSAHKVAVDYVGMLLANGILKPALNSKAKQETAQDMILDYTEKMAVHFHKTFNDPEHLVESVISRAAESAIDESDSDMFDDED